MILPLGSPFSSREQILPPERDGRDSSSKSQSARFSALRIVVLATIVLLLIIAPLLLLYGGKNELPFFGGGGGGPNERSGVVYQSFSSLRGNSTSVVVAGILNLNSSYCDSPHTGCLASNFDFQVNASSYLVGTGPKTFYVTDSSFFGPVVSDGSQYVLFLSNNWTCAPSPPAAPCTLPGTPLVSTYHLVGGAQGKFLVQNGMVYGYKTLYPNDYSWMVVDADSIPLAQFEAQVQS